MTNERLEILIDPDTLSYSLLCENAYIEDIYIILKEIIHSLETGDIDTTLYHLENSSKIDKEQLVQIIGELKHKFDTSIAEEQYSHNTAKSFRD